MLNVYVNVRAVCVFWYLSLGGDDFQNVAKTLLKQKRSSLDVGLSLLYDGKTAILKLLGSCFIGNRRLHHEHQKQWLSLPVTSQLKFPFPTNKY